MLWHTRARVLCLFIPIFLFQVHALSYQYTRCGSMYFQVNVFPSCASALVKSNLRCWMLISYSLSVNILLRTDTLVVGRRFRVFGQGACSCILTLALLAVGQEFLIRGYLSASLKMFVFPKRYRILNITTRSCVPTHTNTHIVVGRFRVILPWPSTCVTTLSLFLVYVFPLYYLTGGFLVMHAWLSQS